MNAEASYRGRKRFAALRVLLYLLILGGVVSVWYVGLSWLLTHGFASNIYAGMQSVSQSWQVPVSTWRLWLAIALLLAVVIFRRRVVAAIATELRTLILPLPFYFLFSNDWRGAAVLALSAAILWVFHGLLAVYMRRISPLLFPLIYVYLLTRSIFQTLGIALLLVALQLLNLWIRDFFEPVWRMQSYLPKRVRQVLLAMRLIVAFSIPPVLSYSLGMVPSGYPHPFPSLSVVFTDNVTLLVVASVLVASFVSQSPTVEPKADA